MATWKLYIILLVTSSLTFGCIQEIDYNATDSLGLLVVDGELSTQSEVHEITLSRTGSLGSSKFDIEPGAQIHIYDQTGKEGIYQYETGGRYTLPASDWPVEVGSTYRIRIETLSGDTYESFPETIQPAPQLDSLHFNIRIDEVVVDETRILERRFIDVFAEMTMPEDHAAPYLKWNIDHVYSVQEIKCHPLHTPKTCYVNRPVNIDQFIIFDGNQLVPGGNYRQKVVTRELDHAFGLVASFYVSQQSVSKEAFTYWEKINQVTNEVGSIFESPPAGVLGNIYNVNNPEEEVLGYFRAVDETRKLLLVRGGDLGEFKELPLCGLPGIPPTPLDPACCNCLSIDSSSTQRPLYWP